MLVRDHKKNRGEIMTQELEELKDDIEKKLLDKFGTVNVYCKENTIIFLTGEKLNRMFSLKEVD